MGTTYQNNPTSNISKSTVSPEYHQCWDTRVGVRSLQKHFAITHLWPRNIQGQEMCLKSVGSRCPPGPKGQFSRHNPIPVGLRVIPKSATSSSLWRVAFHPPVGVNIYIYITFKFPDSLGICLCPTVANSSQL